MCIEKTELCAESINIAAFQILKTPGEFVRIGHVTCDAQHDGFNCGIFAIANNATYSSKRAWQTVTVFAISTNWNNIVLFY